MIGEKDVLPSPETIITKLVDKIVDKTKYIERMYKGGLDLLDTIGYQKKQ